MRPRHRPILLCALSALLAACDRGGVPAHLQIPGASVERGRQLAVDYGCGTCHTIEGIEHARGVVGPPLVDYGSRTHIAGVLPNVPRNLVSWLVDPPAIDPETGMPNVGLSEREARDIAAFLYGTTRSGGRAPYVTRPGLTEQLARERSERLKDDQRHLTGAAVE